MMNVNTDLLNLLNEFKKVITLVENIGEFFVILILFPGKSSNLLTDEAYI